MNKYLYTVYLYLLYEMYHTVMERSKGPYSLSHFRQFCCLRPNCGKKVCALEDCVRKNWRQGRRQCLLPNFGKKVCAIEDCMPTNGRQGRERCFVLN
jgi:hypothetical protein